jgi:peptide subunit release factor 1 (eRF1)
MAVDAPDHQVLKETLQIETRVEREREQQVVKELLNGNGRFPVALGLEPVLSALQEGRIWRLVYAAEMQPRGGQCSNCGALHVRADGACDYCGAPLRAIDNLFEPMTERVIQSDAYIEEVNGPAAVDLKRRADGVGAILRFWR